MAHLQKLSEIHLCVLVGVNLAENVMQLIFRHVFARFLQQHKKQQLQHSCSLSGAVGHRQGRSTSPHFGLQPYMTLVCRFNGLHFLIILNTWIIYHLLIYQPQTVVDGIAQWLGRWSLADGLSLICARTVAVGELSTLGQPVNLDTHKAQSILHAQWTRNRFIV